LPEKELVGRSVCLNSIFADNMEHTFLSIDVVQKVYGILHNAVTNIAIVSEMNQYQLFVTTFSSFKYAMQLHNAHLNLLLFQTAVKF
jgi:hypothetical protein